MTAPAAAEPGNGHPAVPLAPLVEQGDRSAAEPAEILSPSQVNTFLSCPAKWYFKYMRGLPDPKTGALAMGNAVHAAIAAWMSAKMEGEVLSVLAAGEAFSDEWENEVSRAALRDDEDADDIHDQGRQLTEIYIREADCSTDPAAVESAVSGTVGGVKVQGYIDLLDTEGRVIDIKTSAKAPAGIPPDHRLQLITYYLLSNDARGVGRIDYLLKSKRPKLIHFITEIAADDVQYAEAVYPMVQDSIRDGVFYPRRSDRFPCTRRYCAFWRACETEFGGRVSS